MNLHRWLDRHMPDVWPWGGPAPGKTKTLLLSELLEDREVLSYMIGPQDRAYMANAIQRLFENPNLPVESWVVGVRADQPYASMFSDQFRVVRDQPTEYLDNGRFWTFAPGSDNLSIATQLQFLQNAGRVDYFYPLLPNIYVKKLTPNDPFYSQQWHLHAPPSAGINAPGAWDIATGKGINIAIVDDGVQTKHPDLNPNLFVNPNDPVDGVDNDGNGLIDDVNGWDFISNDNDPNPALADDKHGTAVAGLASARGNNSIGVTGSALEAKIVPIRLIGGPTDDAKDAKAMGYLPQLVHISNNSWGPPDTGEYSKVRGPLMKAAMEKGISQGRNGLGTVYVWAGGNGRQDNDNSNYDEYANQRYVIAVGAVDDTGKQASFSEPGANIFIVAGAEGPGNRNLLTTDRTGNAGYNTDGKSPEVSNLDYTNQFSGTSAATPVVSGVVALMLEANPNLTYRDVQYILAATATKTDPSDPGWSKNGAGIWVNHKYGFGRVDAAAAVKAAQTWTSVGPEFHQAIPTQTLNKSIPDNNAAGVEAQFLASGINMVLDWVTITINAKHARIGDLEITLTSPSGTVSNLAFARSEEKSANLSWTFSTNHNWGEDPNGIWTVKVADRQSGVTGTWTDFTLNFYGKLNTSGGTVPPPVGPPLPPPPPPVGPGGGTTGPRPPFIFGPSGQLGPSLGGGATEQPLAIAASSGVPTVLLVNGLTSETISVFQPFGPNYTGTFSVASGDLDGDNIADLIVAPGLGGPPVIQVFSGADGSLLRSIQAFAPSFRGGVSVALGDVNADGTPDIIAGAGVGGGPHVRVFNGADSAVMVEFMAYDVAFRGGVHVSAADFDLNGFAEIVVGAGVGGGPHVRIFDGINGILMNETMAYDTNFRGGVFVATGDIDGDGRPDLAVSPGDGGFSHVIVYNGLSLQPIRNFFAFPLDTQGGARVTLKDVNADNKAEIIVGSGPRRGSRVRVFDSATLGVISDFMPFDGSVFSGLSLG